MAVSNRCKQGRTMSDESSRGALSLDMSEMFAAMAPLTPDVLTLILSFLPASSVLRLSSLNRSFQRVLQDGDGALTPAFSWAGAYTRAFPLCMEKSRRTEEEWRLLYLMRTSLREESRQTLQQYAHRLLHMYEHFQEESFAATYPALVSTYGRLRVRVVGRKELPPGVEVYVLRRGVTEYDVALFLPSSAAPLYIGIGESLGGSPTNVSWRGDRRSRNMRLSVDLLPDECVASLSIAHALRRARANFAPDRLNQQYHSRWMEKCLAKGGCRDHAHEQMEYEIEQSPVCPKCGRLGPSPQTGRTVCQNCRTCIVCCESSPTCPTVCLDPFDMSAGEQSDDTKPLDFTMLDPTFSPSCIVEGNPFFGPHESGGEHAPMSPTSGKLRFGRQTEEGSSSERHATALPPLVELCVLSRHCLKEEAGDREYSRSRSRSRSPVGFGRDESNQIPPSPPVFGYHRALMALTGDSEVSPLSHVVTALGLAKKERLLNALLTALFKSPLLEAVEYKDVEGVRRLLQQKGVHPNEASVSGTTPLLRVCSLLPADRRGYGARSATTHDDGVIDIVYLLLAHKADPDLRDNKGLCPLLAATRSEREDVVLALLEAGAATDIALLPDEDIRDDSLLRRFCYAGFNRAALHLLDRGAVVEEKSLSIFLSLKVFDAKLAAALVAAGADVNLATADETVRTADMRLHPFARATAGIYLCTPLFGSLSRGDLNLAHFLLSQGADPLHTVRGTTALHALCDAGGLARSHTEESIARILLDRGVDVNALNGEGYSALGLWVQTDCADPAASRDPLAELLIERGADPLTGGGGGPGTRISVLQAMVVGGGRRGYRGHRGNVNVATASAIIPRMAELLGEEEVQPPLNRPVVMNWLVSHGYMSEVRISTAEELHGLVPVLGCSPVLKVELLAASRWVRFGLASAGTAPIWEVTDRDARVLAEALATSNTIESVVVRGDVSAASLSAWETLLETNRSITHMEISNIAAGWGPPTAMSSALIDDALAHNKAISQSVKRVVKTFRERLCGNIANPCHRLPQNVIDRVCELVWKNRISAFATKVGKGEDPPHPTLAGGEVDDAVLWD